jgi:lipopolysaccharide transport system permease protein
MNAVKSENHVTIITPPKRRVLIDFNELREYRELFFFLVWRDVKVTYAQTVMGFGWAFLQPLIQILVFTLIFGKIAKVNTDGIPYFLFTTMAIIPWTYISTTMAAASLSLVTNQGMLGKVYFPRLIFPLKSVLSKLVDFAISLLIIVPVMFYYSVSPTWNLVFLPLILVMMIAVPTAAGVWLAALAVRFRDVKFAMQFIVRMLMFTAPIVYSASSIPEGYRLLYSLNPLVGVTEGMRACLLGLTIEWQYIIPGMITTAILLVTGIRYFNRMERVYADVV